MKKIFTAFLFALLSSSNAFAAVTSQDASQIYDTVDASPTCAVSNCSTCDSSGTKCTKCNSGYTLSSDGTCTSSTTSFSNTNFTASLIDSGIQLDTSALTTTNTVKNCPTGTTKSSNGCCCIAD